MEEVAIRESNSLADLTKNIDYKGLTELATSLIASKFTNLSNVEEAIGAIIIGHELGFKPGTSVMLGKMLNRQSLISVIKGRSLGIFDPITAMQNIHVFNGGQGEIVYTGIHVINAILLKANVKTDILEDYKPLYKYTVFLTDENGNIVYKDGKPVVEDIITTDELNESYEFITKDKLKVSVGKTAAFKQPAAYDFRTTVQMTRIKDGIIHQIKISYTLKDAIEAGLYPGIASDGTVYKGKDNWKKNPKGMNRNRSMALCGRIIAADFLGNVYDESEIGETIHTSDGIAIDISNTGHNDAQ